MSNCKRGYPKNTILKFFIEVPGLDKKPKYWNLSDKEMHILSCLNVSSELKQKLILVPISEDIDSDHVDNSISKNTHISKYSKIENSAEK
ncbi:36763_t:CDS:2 [Racocetra persica]|uniref:36763_t:CDS:1 n=1 Tax=Racocetra persica TaxID=160502 RepID=A0ACA9PP21_9GLOM|nr:36763_t:CDS:2 [Racocetra persica]